VIAALVSLLWFAQAAAPAGGGEAEALFREGLKAYDAKEYARAIESFEAAHRLSPLPEILFDIAMAHRALGDCPRATKAFDVFIVAAPADDPLLARARARRAELGSCATARDGVAGVARSQVAAAEILPLGLSSPQPKGAGTAPAVLIAPAQESPPPRHARAWLRNTCFASLGGTAVLGVGGLVFGLEARAAQRDVEDAMTWGPDAARTHERGGAFGQVATTLLVSAGVTAAVAAASCIASSRSGTGR
jgi:tetratricopeptide (TPR) repeat protein